MGDSLTGLSSWSRKTSDFGLDGFLVRNITLVISFLISASRSLKEKGIYILQHGGGGGYNKKFGPNESGEN